MGGPQLILNLAAVSLSDASALVRIPILQLGRWVKGTLSFSITRDDVKRLVANFRKRMMGEIVIDYEHASEFPQQASGGPAPAAGWLKAIEDAPDAQGILWGLAEFTARARRMIAEREYKYLSPAIDWAFRDKSSGEQQGATLTSMGLVNRPFLEALPAVQLSEAGWQEEGGGNANMAGTLFEDFEKLDEFLGGMVKERVEKAAIPYKQALLQIGAENPALFKLREALYRKRERGKFGTKVYEWVDGRLRQIEEELKGFVTKAQAEHPELSAGGVLRLVASEHPDLFREREQLRDM